MSAPTRLRGGARLSEQLNPKTEMGARTLKALAEEHWDYVVLQEMSNAPVTTRERFLATAAALCDKIHSSGAPRFFTLHGHTRRAAYNWKSQGWIMMKCTMACRTHTEQRHQMAMP